MIPFNKPPRIGNEDVFLRQALEQDTLSGDGPFTRRCEAWFRENLPCRQALMTPSCTHALEMAALLIDIRPGDEVIMPSYTFVSTANAFALRGAKIVFVDIRPDTMNIDEKLIEAAITEKTRAIVPVHYAGVGCEMDTIMDIANRYGLWVIEDAAQAMTSTYKGKALGTIGHLGCYSFHETKNYTSGGEGGLLIVNDERFIERAEIIREKGTNRKKFFRGEVDKYSWVDLGSSYLPSELQAAYLYAQLQEVDTIFQDRLLSWEYYFEDLSFLAERGDLTLPFIPSYVRHNAHMFYIKTNTPAEQNRLLNHLKDKEVMAVFHYIPLHTAPAGSLYGYFHGKDLYTSRESKCLIRLPLYFGLGKREKDHIVKSIRGFYEN